jgi:hypothetical protein
MEFHPLANIFPVMSDQELRRLADDIAAHGQLVPIYLFEGMILDGRNRYLACRLLRLEPRYHQWQHDDLARPGGPLAFVISHNVQRRHLTESQRAVAAAKLATLDRGQHPHDRGVDSAQVLTSKGLPDTPIGVSQIETSVSVALPEAAELLSVGERSVTRAREILQRGDESLVAAVEAGIVSVNDASRVTKRSKEVQRAALELVTSGKAKTVARAAEQIEPTKTSPPTAGASRATKDDESAEESMVALRRRDLACNEERVRNLRWKVSKLLQSSSTFPWRETLNDILEHVADVHRSFEDWLDAGKR